MNCSNTLSVQPFTFKSTSHQRYEDGVPVLGLQKCIRTISVEKNTNGCKGYKLSPGIGYIVKIYNDDIQKPNMSDKPMVVVNKTFNKVDLRGFPIEAQGPFGCWVEVDYRDYGLTIYYKDGEVDKCVLHMFDRNIDIEYLTDKTDKEESSDDKPLTEKLVDEAIEQMKKGNDGDAVYNPLYKAWKAYCDNPKELNKIRDYASYAQGLVMFLSFGTVNDIDTKQQISSIAYLFISKAIEHNPSDINLYKNRLLIMILFKDVFEYTVSSVVGMGQACFWMSLTPFEGRDSLFKMEYADLSVSPKLQYVNIFKQVFLDLEQKINSDFFGQNKTTESIISEGKKLHKDVLLYLESKILKNNDIDF